MIRNRFRWVFCQLEALRHCFPSNLRRILDELPKSLDDTYKRILREINNANQVHAYQLLQCLTVASRPLYLEELAEVLAFDLSPGGIPKLNAAWRLENQEEAVLSACSSLVSVIIDSEDGSCVVQFSHFSVKEFLTSVRLANCMEESQFYIPVEPSHTILAQACLGVLLSLADCPDEDSVRKLPLYQHAMAHWVQHSQVGNVELLMKDTLDHFFDMDKPHFSAWARRDYSVSWMFSKGSEDEHTDVPPSAAPLFFAAWRGFHSLVERLLIKYPQQIHHMVGQNGTPLHASMYGGHIEVARFLFAHGAGINSCSSLNLTPLHIASETGHVEIVKWLLDHGADVNFKEAGGLIPLHFSASDGHLEVCRMLLEHGAVANTQSNTGSTPFLEASKKGHTDIVWLLLDHNPDVNVCDSQDGSLTPLHHAAMQGLLKFVQKLLKLKAEVNSCNKQKFTPLFLASQFGRTDVVRVLLDHNADVNAQDNDGDTSLHVSVGYGRLEITRMLLECGAEVNFQNNNGSTPLLRASGDEYEGNLNLDVVQLLLDHGADVHVRNLSGQTASEVAFNRGRHEIVRLLSQYAAE
jgi:ankyrin repeat protein